MTLVIDASVALKWFLAEPDTPEAEALVSRGERLIAPNLVVAEIANAAWKRFRRGQMSAAHADLVAASAAGEFDALEPIETLTPRAMTLARELGHPIYDCLYLALAEREGAPLVTADRRLLSFAGSPFTQAAIVALSDA